MNIDITSTSDSSKISTNAMTRILEFIKLNRNRISMRENYIRIWHLFNKFIIKLDVIPDTWEDRVYLFLAYLVHTRKKSATVKSYLSAIRTVLTYDNHELNENTVQLQAITRACKLSNNFITPRFPIKIELLETILFETTRILGHQPYLVRLYQVVFALAYYGLLRIGEIARSNHTIKAKNVHLAENKNKIKIFLYTSKMHGMESLPQKIRIEGLDSSKLKQKRHFCPFKIMKNYLIVQGNYLSETEQFFVFQGHIPLEQIHVRVMLAKIIKNLGLNAHLYQFHGIRAGRATDLSRWGFSIEQIKVLGRWKSNAVYKYLKH